jgi:hypothetical protein
MTLREKNIFKLLYTVERELEANLRAASRAQDKSMKNDLSYCPAIDIVHRS